MSKLYPFGNFKYGLVNKLPIQNVPDGAAYDSLNWQTIPGRIELARGYTPLGSVTAGNGRITGLKTTRRADNTEVLFRTDGQSLRYYSTAISDWVETGTNLLGTAANGEDITLDFFEPVAGKQLWLNSPHAGPYKVMVANPGDATSMYDSSKNYKAWMRIFDNQAYIWNIDNFDRTGVLLSYIETRDLTDHTQVLNEALGTGDGLITQFNYTLAQKVTTPKATFLNITTAGGTETFTDDLNGNLTGSAGGTGTINYTTGVIVLNFATAPLASAAITVTYRYVDETAIWTTHRGGLMNFITPASRVSGEPNAFRQDRGGDLKTIIALKDHKFCGHLKSIFDLLPNLDDTKTTNTLYRDNLGTLTLRGLYASPEGIYGVDTTDPNDQRFVTIQYSAKTTDIKPVYISNGLDLSGYTFDQVAVFAFGDYILYACRTNDSSYNNRTFIYNRRYRFWDILDYAISTADIYSNTLVAGDSLSNSVYTLFSGYDANGDVINNFWTSGISKLGYITPRGTIRKIYGLKKVKKIVLEGDIAPDQTLHLYASLDRGPFTEVLDEEGNPIIQGSGSYIDPTQSVDVGADVLGDHAVGGGGSGVTAYHYSRYLNFAQAKFAEVQFRFQATGIGYCSVTKFEMRDLRTLQDKPARKYRVL